MSPTILVRGGRAAIVAGGSGGPRIISGTLQVLLGVLYRGVGPGEAVRAPRVHHQWLPDLVRIEPHAAPGTAAGLAARGHRVAVARTGSAVQIVIRTEAGGLEAASDPRKGGVPAGY
jgi:gamma-glutamyltranspeptidase/glutathione hydrolase